MKTAARSGRAWLVFLGVMGLFPTLARAAPALMRVGYHNRAASSGAGSEAFTHNLGTTPKAMILWTSNQTSNTNETTGGAGGFLGIGLSDGTRHYSVGFGLPDVTASAPSRRRVAATAIHIVDGSGTVSLEGTVAFSATQVTFTWSTRTSSAQTGINYILFGGNVVEARVEQWTTGTNNTTDRGVTAFTGMKPNVCFNIWGGPTAVSPTSSEAAGSIGISAFDLAERQWVNYMRFGSGLAESRGYRYTSTSNMFAVLADSYNTNPPTHTIDRSAFIESLDTNGFTIDTNGTTSVDVRAASLCMQNINAWAGSFARVGATNPQNQDVNGLLFTPSALLISTTQLGVSSDDIEAMARLVVGASDLTRNVVASAMGENSEAAPEAHSHWRNDKVGIIANGVLGNVTGYATLTTWLSSPSGGFRWAWNPNQIGGTLNLYSYVAVATPSALAIDLEGFQAETTGKQLHFRWRTGLEANSLGFHIVEERAGKQVRLTPDLIAGSSFLLGSQQTSSGQTYQWSTLAGRNSPGAQYWLEEIDLQGKSTLHGPFTARQVSPATDLVARTSSALLSEVSQAPGPAEVGLPRGRRLNFLPPRPLRPATVEPSWTAPGGPAIKIAIKQDGLYRVGQPELLAAGLDPAGDPRRLRLYTDGREVPLRLSGEDDGRLDPGDAIELYGEGLDTPDTDTRVYWLVASGRGPVRRMTTEGAPAKRPEAESFPFTIQLKEKSSYFPALLNGDGENFFGPVISTGLVERTIKVHHLDTGAGSAQLQLSLQGMTEVPHRVQVQLNGRALGPVEWPSRDLRQATLTVPIGPEGLVEGDNLITLGTDEATDVALLDHLRLSYPHRLVADGDAQRVTVAPGQAISIAGFAGSDVRAFDVTDPLEASELAVTTRAQDEGVTASVSPAREGPRTLLLLGGQRVVAASATADQRSNLRQPQEGADLIILTHARLAAAAAPLEALREQQGMKVMVVDVQDVYDEFSFGHKDPRTLREFLRLSQKRFRRPPKYVLLLGDASIDPRNFLGAGDNDLVPTKQIDVDPLQTASDDWFADFGERGVADLAIGRIPARTLEQAQAIIDKLVRHERSWTGEQNGALMVSDAPTMLDSFEEITREVAGVLPGWLPVDVRVRGKDAFTDPASLVTAMNAGPLLVNYVGHGSTSLWRGLLDNDQVAKLTNRDRPSLVVAMTCLNGLFQDPRNTTLAEALLGAPEGGAFAVWTSSGFNPVAGQSQMDQAFLRAALADGVPLGEAARVAKAAVGNTDASRTWILFGDPSRSLPTGSARPWFPPGSNVAACAMVAAPVTGGTLGVGSLAGLALLVRLLVRRRRPGRRS